MICSRCKQELIYPGGFLLSPPSAVNFEVKKYDLCILCYEIIRQQQLNGD